MADGCTEYVVATVSIVFQPGHVDCAHCPLLETYARKQCRRTAEYIVDERGTGLFCPLVFSQQDKDIITKERYSL